MAKVLVERPRVLGGFCRGSRKGYRRQVSRAMERDDGGGARCEGIKVRGGGQKHFNEHLGPLRRYLDSQVGRPWNTIHSEICQHIDRGSVVQKHILTHLFQYVETGAVLIDGVPHHPPHAAWRGPRPIEGRHAWYVCPRTGLLKRAPQRKPRRPKPVTQRHWLNASQFCERTPSGIWILVTLRPLDENAASRDVYLNRSVSGYDGWRLTEAYGRPVRAVAVKWLTTAELRTLPVPIDVLRPIVQHRVRA